MKRLLSYSVICLVVCAAALSQQAGRRAMSVDDMLNMVGVSGPEISPDGKWVIFSRSELNWKENKRPSQLWIVPANGGEAFRFTSGDSDSQPQWSPDSSRIAFIRSGKEPQERQVYIIRVNGGEAEKLTDHKDGVSSFRWGAGGKQIIFLANDQKSDADKKKEKEGDDAIFVDEGPNGQSRGQWSNIWAFNLADKKERQVTREKMLIGSYDPSPDGKLLAFSARRENTRNGSNLAEVFIADLTSGAVTRLTANEAPESSPQWSPDGKSIAYLAPDDKKWELANSKIWVLDVESRAYRNASAKFDGSIGEYVWTKDGKRIIFNGQQGTNWNLYELDPGVGAVRQLTKKEGVFYGGSLSSDSKKAVAVYSTPQQPPDLWVADVATGDARQLTRLNPWVNDLALAKSEVIRWKSKDGMEVEGILHLPGDYKQGTRIPLVLNIHGGPAGSFTYGFQSIYHVYAGLGYASLSPNVRGSSGYSDALLRGNMGDLGGGDYQDLMTGVDAVIARGIADPDRLGVKGWSYGGVLGGWTITQTNRFKAASLGAMVSDWASEYAMGFNHDVRLWYIGGTPWENPEGYRKASSYTHIKNVTTPTIIFHGEQDITDTIGQSMIFYQGLKDRGVPARFIRFPREPHAFREPRHQRLKDVEEIAWMQKYIMGAEWTSVRPEEKDDKKEEKKDKEKAPEKPNK
ncbi:MAG TPA: S9 family peptidase [Blastocatellia bacterium]|jgi:dipeptidyl aminopeptidase/acylaminoacyl peptidase